MLDYVANTLAYYDMKLKSFFRAGSRNGGDQFKNLKISLKQLKQVDSNFKLPVGVGEEKSKCFDSNVSKSAHLNSGKGRILHGAETNGL
jgi:hypothetical protein